MHWNYRIVKIPCEGEHLLDVEPHFKYEIHEVYYESDGTPTTRTLNTGLKWATAYECEEETVEDVVKIIEMVLRGIKDKPVLNEEEIKYNRLEEGE